MRRSILTTMAVATFVGATLPAITTTPSLATDGVLIEGCAVADHAGGEWRSYGKSADNSRFQDAESTIGPVEAATLEPVWALSTVDATGDGGAGDITGTPAVADGCMVVGTNGGFVIAADADTGEVAWATKAPGGGSINSSITVDGGVAYAAVSRGVRQSDGCSPHPACGGSYVAALDMADGSVLHTSAPIDFQPGSDVYASPVLVDAPDGRRAVMMGVSGGAAELGDEDDRYAFQGAMVFLDTADLSLIKKTWTIRPPVSEGGIDDDYAGGTIWSTPSPVHLPGADHEHVAFVGVGNPFKPWAEHEYTNAVVGYDVDPVSATWGEIIGSYKGQVDSYFPIPEEDSLPCFDIEGNPPPWYPQGAGKCFDIDLDFGASPNVLTDPDTGRTLIGAGQKSGVYHVFDAETFEPAWSTLVGPGGPVGGVVGSTAFDGERIYGPVTVPGHIWSISMDSPEVDGTRPLQWATPLGDGVHWGNPVAAANGVVYTMDFAGNLNALEATTGALLLKRPLHLGSGMGADAPIAWGGVSVARNTVYATVGISGLPNGYVVAFRPQQTVAVNLPPLPALPELPSVATNGATDSGQVVSQPGALLSTYATPAVVIQQGQTLTHTNLDIARHDIKSDTDAWESELIGLGETETVESIATLPAGEYGFYCSLHRGMQGTLVIV